VRLSTTSSLQERRDVVVVSSVSCIYGIGSPEDNYEMRLFLETGQRIEREDVLRRLVEIQYVRNDAAFFRGCFRVRGDVVDVYRGHDNKRAVRIEFFGDEIEALSEIDALRGARLRPLQRVAIFPASHFVTSRPNIERATESIREELAERLEELRAENRLLEAQRLEQRTRYDLEMLQEMGSCAGIENYSRHLDGRRPGEPPYTLLDYFPKDWLLFVDESHVTMPQVRAMYRGDRSRKSTLVEHGFRLPSALDNRPLRFDEFQARLNDVLYVSATPAEYELEQSGGIVVEQVIRPTGLLEPLVEVRPAESQVDDLLEEIRNRVERDERVLVTTLTKRMAEDLTQYYKELGVEARYLHSDIATIERTEIIRDLRAGKFHALIGVNLLREGLDLPEVSLVAVLDADKQGFLRDRTSLIQTCGRAARNVDGRVILYADVETRSMREAVQEMQRRRAKQAAYNEKEGVTPRGIKKEVKDMLESVTRKDEAALSRVAEERVEWVPRRDLPKQIEKVRKEMLDAAGKLEFERAAELRDRLLGLQRQALEL